MRLSGFLIQDKTFRILIQHKTFWISHPRWEFDEMAEKEKKAHTKTARDFAVKKLKKLDSRTKRFVSFEFLIFHSNHGDIYLPRCWVDLNSKLKWSSTSLVFLSKKKMPHLSWNSNELNTWADCCHTNLSTNKMWILFARQHSQFVHLSI